ncbi:MAG: hypothetical protein A2499_12245 [Stygiobacter sp. RIFOXYC12_FULL_38_8]|nr:MAG: hypothetical protein A2X62_17115 [Stygiobacter sp. GWC2_38_9]OGU82284.1 MAG: hypothetical protein A2279_00805 [Stygiobacter sp. RIFOXYA12_FULL_38_9]OGV06698.1 MAG: hypothetical protein A2299_01790 [Stygiobacter sp. RIFOXYB2_FULL_37_11]OGV10349.1 MAG: hypothetical protein A2237_14080 [Stygiobacter sp. RIFOXYA2_FULL_38_8]OGV15081.1 MAG: hypothetical protein A2440_06950 [Stygiobacter sp. RIFOXYC2_FULL_38_25]OGV23914.1 MAG: hypothetical protein A2499_12245 [Stygiobacter sp. RIFOXYC12_FULL_
MTHATRQYYTPKKQTLLKRKSLRLPGYDYSKGNWYYITICVDKMQVFFGEIHNEKMIQNDCGEILSNNWSYLSQHFTTVLLDEFIIMPNHLHGIVIINEEDNITLGQIVRFLKARTTKLIHDAGLRDFKWQRNYFEHVIRNESDLYNIRNYIKQNPLRWHLEKNEHVSNW